MGAWDTCNSVNIPLAVTQLIGISSRTDWKSLRERFDEERRVHFKNCTTIWMRLLYIVYWMMYLPHRKILHALNPKGMRRNGKEYGMSINK